jgi:hypothetical protein
MSLVPMKSGGNPMGILHRISYLTLEGFGNASRLSGYGKNLSSQRHYNKKPTLLTFINHEIQSRGSGEHDLSCKNMLPFFSPSGA